MISPEDIAVYIVNLPRRPDRRAWIAQRLPSELTPIYTSDWDHVVHDGQQLTSTALHSAGIELFDWQIDSDNSWWSRPLKFGEIGCTLAHLACWSHAADNSAAQYILVLEDDAVLATGFLEQLRLSLHRIRHRRLPGDLIYLGRYPLEADFPTPIPGIVRPGYSHCSYAYMLTRPALGRVLDAGLPRAIVPIDEFLPAMYLPHPRQDLRLRFPARLTALALDPPLATQRPKAEAGSDTERSDFVA